MSAHQWSTNPSDNQTADARAQWPEGQPASSLNNSARGTMASAALWRDDHLGTLVATLGAGNTYTIATNEGLIDPASIAGGGTAKISKPFTLRVVLPAMNTAVATTKPTVIIDGAAAVPLKRRDGSDLADGDLTGLPVEILGDAITAGAYSRARILDLVPSNIAPAVDINAIYARIETRATAIADDRRNSSVTNLRWIEAGFQYMVANADAAVHFPFGRQAVLSDRTSVPQSDGSYNVGGFQYKYLQMFIPYQGWVTAGWA